MLVEEEDVMKYTNATQAIISFLKSKPTDPKTHVKAM